MSLFQRYQLDYNRKSMPENQQIIWYWTKAILFYLILQRSSVFFFSETIFSSSASAIIVQIYCCEQRKHVFLCSCPFVSMYQTHFSLRLTSEKVRLLFPIPKLLFTYFSLFSLYIYTVLFYLWNIAVIWEGSTFATKTNYIVKN